MGFLNLFTGRNDAEFIRYEPRVTEYPSFEGMLSDYYSGSGGWAGNGLIDFGQDGKGFLQHVEAMTPAEFFISQPHFREVVTFIARNMAQLGLHTFRRVGENDRQRDRKNVFAQSLMRPDVRSTDYELMFDLVIDLMLYDQAFWWIIPNAETWTGKPFIFRRLPPAWVEEVSTDPWTVVGYRVWNGKKDNKPFLLKPDEVLHFPGYHPSRPGKCSPVVESLKQILTETMSSLRYRNQVWARGGRVSSVISRPKDARRWSDEARQQFREDWKSKFTGEGPESGGTPILEDGMTIQNIDFNAREQEFSQGMKLSKAQVASSFHVNPTMVGLLENASYSNVKEFRRMLYGDTLGPLIAQIEARINQFLLPMLGMDNTKFYCEFNINEKMQGSFEEQTQAIQAATGVAWMTRNEARSLQNLPALEGGDELITPLNVLIGGQASPQDSGSQNEGLTDPVNPPSEQN